MRIRPADPADIDAILAIWNPIIRDTAITFTSQEKTRDDISAMLAGRSASADPFLVAEMDGVVVGFATYQPFRAGPGYRATREISILLAPEARGGGIGRALVRSLVEHAQSAGIHVLVAGISGANEAALAFHARLGFVEAGCLAEVGWKFGRWHDLHLMTLCVPPG